MLRKCNVVDCLNIFVIISLRIKKKIELLIQNFRESLKNFIIFLSCWVHLVNVYYKIVNEETEIILNFYLFIRSSQMQCYDQ